MRNILVFLALWLGSQFSLAGPAIVVETQSASEWFSGCVKHPALCVPRCQRDAQFCAKQLNDYLIEAIEGVQRFRSFRPYPGTGMAHANTITPMHGAFLTIYVNDIAENYIVNKLQNDPKWVVDVDFPNGSVIAKLNSVSADMSNPPGQPWLTVMMKLDGYCHADFGGTGNCNGGEWFYYLYRFGKFHYFDNVPVFGKPQAFCVDCHGPVQKGDYLWTTFENLTAVQANTTQVKAEQAARDNTVKFCADTPIDATIPSDVALNPNVITNQPQLMFDCLSWRSFLALNWPAQIATEKDQSEQKRGIPALGKQLTDLGPRVWETYRSVFETFQPDDPDWTLKDQQWDDLAPLDPVCEQSLSMDKLLRMGSKNRASSVIDEEHQAFGNQFNILVDQNGNRTHYEVRLNRDEFEFLKANGYADTGNYDTGGPKALLNWKAKPLQFPDNVRGHTKTGAIEIKVAWRVLCTDVNSCLKLDNPDRFYSRKATLFANNPITGKGSCSTATVGMVGFHIAHKTFWAPQWVWSTFEHIENVPPAGQYPLSDSRKTSYSFYSPWLRKHQPSETKCQTQRPGIFTGIPDPITASFDAACPNLQSIFNSQPSIHSQVVAKNTKGGLTPNQVTRVDPITQSPLNQAYVTKLRAMGSVFQHYHLVNTQWPLHGRGSPVDTTINLRLCQGEASPNCYSIIPKDLLVRNVALETYQVSYHLSTGKDANGQSSSGGCTRCHGRSAPDFSFVWTDAVEEPVPLQRDNLSVPPRGSYKNSCQRIVMNGVNLKAICIAFDGTSKPTQLANAHLCSGDIANINGKLLCNPPVGSFTLTCNSIDVQDNILTAQCLKSDGRTRGSGSLNIEGYTGTIANCDGVLTKDDCV